eukprot:TRINITY_DN578_c1_g2_i1.p1 TRINITY_DN578_c1_g2~~TRINITY_DN578_c1_g2_i1.p1  ORF type:complete len:1292 (+),score=322.03 TRINITY_DN578_c1_g2_i1:441-3878(+)
MLGLDKEQLDNTVSSVRFRVFVVLKTWVERLWNSSTDPELVARLQQFITEVSVDMHKVANQLSKAIDRATSGEEASLQAVFDRPPPITILPLCVSLGSPFTPETCSFETLHTKELARQMTLIERNLFKAIKPWELIGLAWTKRDKSLAPNIQALTNHFNNMNHWVMTEMCACEDLKQRCRVLEKFLDLCHFLDELHNYNAILEILSGLQTSPVYRLKKTWAAISPYHQKTFTELKALTAHDQSYAALRQCLHNLSPPCVPYLGTYQSDLTFIEEGNKTFLEPDVVNFTKCRLLASVIMEIQQYQQAPYNLESNAVIQEWLLSRSAACKQPDIESALYKRSQIIEPKTEENETRASDEVTSSSGAHVISIVDAPVAAAGGAVGVDVPDDAGASSSETAQVSVLFPGDRAPTPVLLPANATVGEVKRTLLDKWSKIQHKFDYAREYRRHVSWAPAAQYTLVGVTSPTGSCFTIADHFTFAHLLITNPSFADKKGSDYFAFLESPYEVTSVYIASDLSVSSRKIVLIDKYVPLFAMIPLFENAFGIESEFVMAYYEHGKLRKWVNSNCSLMDHNPTPTGVLVLISLDVISKDPDGQLKNKLAMEGAVINYMSVVKAKFGSGYRPALPDLQGKSKKPNLVFEKRRCFLLLDHFLFIYKDQQEALPRMILPLEYYEVTLAESGQPCVVLRRMVTFKNSRDDEVVISSPQDSVTRSLLTNMRQKSRMHENTTLFGVDLRTLAARPCVTSLVPSAVQDILTTLLNKGIDNDKIFTTDTSNSIIERIKFQLDLGVQVDLNDVDVYVLGDLLKLFLAELPEPLFTNTMSGKLLRFAEAFKDKPDMPTLKILLERVPEPNQALATSILQFLRYWSDNCSPCCLSGGGSSAGAGSPLGNSAAGGAGSSPSGAAAAQAPLCCAQAQRVVAALFGPLFLRPRGEAEQAQACSPATVTTLMSLLLAHHHEFITWESHAFSLYRRKCTQKRSSDVAHKMQVFTPQKKQVIDELLAPACQVSTPVVHDCAPVTSATRSASDTQLHARLLGAIGDSDPPHGRTGSLSTAGPSLLTGKAKRMPPSAPLPALPPPLRAATTFSAGGQPPACVAPQPAVAPRTPPTTAAPTPPHLAALHPPSFAAPTPPARAAPSPPAAATRPPK